MNAGEMTDMLCNYEKDAEIHIVDERLKEASEIVSVCLQPNGVIGILIK